jgi:hypothetical protein
MTKPTIVTFANEAYIPVARNWMAALDAAGVSAPIRIVALDAATRDAFPAARVLFRPCKAAGLGDLWTFRIRVLRELLEESSGLVHSDADAVWMRDPLPMIADCATEMVFSQGTIWPPDVHAKHGIVLCCGLYYLSNTPSVRRFMAQLEARVAHDRDDQVSVNRLLDEQGVEWVIEEPYRIPFEDTDYIVSRRIILSRHATPLSVAVLPHHLFPRVMEGPDPKVIVAHPFSPKSCADKIAVLSRLGLWF